MKYAALTLALLLSATSAYAAKGSSHQKNVNLRNSYNQMTPKPFVNAPAAWRSTAPVKSDRTGANGTTIAP